MSLRSRHSASGPALLLGLLLLVLPPLACGAPPAVVLKGEAADAVTKGIASGTGRMDHGLFDRALKAHIREEGAQFDYAGMKGDPQNLNTYLDQVRNADLSSLSRNELLALLINAYNACTIQTILETMTPDSPRGVDSIRDIPDVFDRKTHRVGGFTLSLNNIEHNLIRPLFRDPRIHFAVNCASIGCPPLPGEAFVGARIDEELDEAARQTLSSPAYVRVEGGRLMVTNLLTWYGGDFVDPGFRGSEKTLPGFIRKYASDDVRKWIDDQGGDPPVSFLDYDWSLNRAP